jgi:hypothetical protein
MTITKRSSRPSDVLLTRYYKIFSDPGIDDIVQSRLGLRGRFERG